MDSNRSKVKVGQFYFERTSVLDDYRVVRKTAKKKNEPILCLCIGESVTKWLVDILNEKERTNEF